MADPDGAIESSRSYRYASPLLKLECHCNFLKGSGRQESDWSLVSIGTRVHLWTLRLCRLFGKLCTGLPLVADDRIISYDNINSSRVLSQCKTIYPVKAVNVGRKE